MSSRKLRPKRGTTVQNDAYTGAVGEVTVDTDKKTLVVHDGVTAGGQPLPTVGGGGGVPTSTSPNITYITDISGTQTTTLRSRFTQAISAPLSKGVVTVDCNAALSQTVKVFLIDNVTSWVFSDRPSVGLYNELDIYIIQGSTPKTCVSPATAGKTAGGAWTVSGVANSIQRLTLKVTDTEVEMYPYPVLS